MPTKWEAFITLLKQPSTMKGILGLLTVIATKFGLSTLVSPEDYASVIEGVATIYFLIAIFYQKS